MALFMPPVTGKTLKRLNRAKTRYMIDTFLGYNATLRPGENQWADEENLSSDDFPVCSQRQKRKIKQLSRVQGITAKDSLIYVDNGTLYNNGEPVELGTLSLLPGEKTLVSFGAYVIIFPDKIMYNTAAPSGTPSVSAMEKHFASSGTVRYSMARIDGNDLANVKYSPTEPQNPGNGAYWVDTSAVPNALKQWSSNTSMWVEISSTYIRIEADNINGFFEKGDSVRISGSDISDLNNTMVIWDKGQTYIKYDEHGEPVTETKDFIVVAGILSAVHTQSETLYVNKELPEMDFVVEANNRLWGCKYGFVNGQTVNEIYASKLGDPTNFYSFMGTAADSYAVSLGTDGVFTGAANYLGYPIFFKEDCIHKVYGHYPSNFQVQTTKARGVQKGSSKSIALVDERLYYKSTVDVCVYDGSLPQSVSDELGDTTLKNAVAGSLGKKYYLSATDGNNRKVLLVLDTHKGIWHKETPIDVIRFAVFNDELIAADNTNNTLISMTGKGNILPGWTDEQEFTWSALSGKLGYSMPDKKYPLRLNFRLLLHAQSSVTLSVSFDDGEFLQVGSLENTGESDEIKALSLVPHRCHHFVFKLEGTGRTEIVSVTKTIKQGSDR